MIDFYPLSILSFDKNKSCYYIKILGETMLLDYAFLFLIFALIAGILGFSGLAQESAQIAKILFVVFLAIYIASLLFNRV